jgi:hypothetical protein
MNVAKIESAWNGSEGKLQNWRSSFPAIIKESPNALAVPMRKSCWPVRRGGIQAAVTPAVGCQLRKFLRSWRNRMSEPATFNWPDCSRFLTEPLCFAKARVISAPIKTICDE